MSMNFHPSNATGGNPPPTDTSIPSEVTYERNVPAMSIPSSNINPTITPASQTSSTTLNLSTLLNFFNHPSLHKAAGVVAAGLASFTSAVPATDRISVSALGIAYAVATDLIQKIRG